MIFMKKSLIAAIAAVCMAFMASAQDENLAPGIYSIIDGQATRLTYTSGAVSSSSVGVLGLDLGKQKYSYKGETAGVPVKDKIVMVIDPGKSNVKCTPKVFDPFIKTMSPEKIIIVPLSAEKNKRVYDPGRKINGFNVEKKERMDFEWELTAENTYTITVDYQPGEYAIVFKYTELAGFDYTAIYGFCVEGEQ